MQNQTKGLVDYNNTSRNIVLNILPDTEVLKMVDDELSKFVKTNLPQETTVRPLEVTAQNGKYYIFTLFSNVYLIEVKNLELTKTKTWKDERGISQNEYFYVSSQVFNIPVILDKILK